MKYFLETDEKSNFYHMRQVFQILLLIFILSSCEKKPVNTYCSEFNLENPTLNDSIDYSIINSVLEQYSHSKFFHISQEITLNNVTVGEDYIRAKLSDECIEYDTLIITNYSERNATKYFIADSCLLRIVHAINPEEIVCLFSESMSGWKKYYQKYPNSKGIFYFSIAGLNEQKNQAIIEYRWAWDEEGAEWYIVILDRINGKWTVTHRILTVIS